MSIRTLLLAASLLVVAGSPAMAENFLIHIHTGAENPTKAALGFLVAATAQKEGHEVTVFLAGDGASLIEDEAIASVEGTGTGKLSEQFAAFTSAGGKIFVSGMSAKARNIGEDALVGKSAEFAMPTKLVELAAAADVVLVY
jgi:predicted peroxiredoxin